MRDFRAISILGCGAITLGVAWALVAGWIPAPRAHPNERSLHAVAVPRIGGIAIWSGCLAVLPFTPLPPSWVIPMIAVLSVSLIDDWRGLPAWVRLTVQFAAALGVVLPMHQGIDGAAVALIALEVLAIVWMANLYNFMDGADGLAGAMGLFGFGAYASASALAGDSDLELLCATLAMGCAAFLAFNRPPARLFMGDVGAVGLGFAAALIGLHGIATGAWQWWLPPLVFVPFIVDSTVTLLRRMSRGQHVARAHREHFYQRAIMLDGAHRPTLFAYGAWMLGCGIAAVAAQQWLPAGGGALLVLLALAFGAYCRSIDKRWAAHRLA